MPTHRTMMIRENEDELRLNMDLLQERREAAAIREAKYKAKMEQYYNRRVKLVSFKPGEYVFCRNKASRVEDQGKLGPKWEGPYKVMEAYQNEPTYQVVLDALALTTCYFAFLVTADVPDIYMQQFWFTINKKDSTTYKFKIDKKSYRIDMEVFRKIFQICPRLSNKDFDEIPSDDEIVSFIKELGHKGDIKYVTEVVVD
ncbi:hypothetical protein Tco_1408391 [Tanacetum coccineum]